MTKPAEEIKQDAPRAHFLATKIYWVVKELLESQTVLHDAEICCVADAASDAAKTALQTYYRDRK